MRDRTELVDRAVDAADHISELASVDGIYATNGNVSVRHRRDSIARTLTFNSTMRYWRGDVDRVYKSGTTSTDVMLVGNAPSSATWEPTDVDGLVLDLDPSNPNIVLSGGRVTRLPERAYGMTLVNSGTGPLWEATGWGGVAPAIRHQSNQLVSPVDATLELFRSINGQYRPFAIVMAVQAVVNNEFKFYWSIGNSSGTNTTQHALQDSGSKFRFTRFGSTGATGGASIDGGFSSDLARHHIVWVYTGRSSYIYQDGVLILSPHNVGISLMNRNPFLANKLVLGASFKAGATAAFANDYRWGQIRAWSGESARLGPSTVTKAFIWLQSKCPR